MQGLQPRSFGRRWIAWLASVCMAWLLAGCGPRYEPPLMVGTNIWAGCEPLYLARDLGYYDGQPLRLVELGSTTQVMDALRTGRLDVAGVTLDEALTLAHEGADFCHLGHEYLGRSGCHHRPPTPRSGV